MGEFFDMGGYAAFVWPGYAITAVVMIGLIVTSIRSNRQALHQMDESDTVYKPKAQQQTADASNPKDGGAVS